MRSKYTPQMDANNSHTHAHTRTHTHTHTHTPTLRSTPKSNSYMGSDPLTPLGVAAHSIYAVRENAMDMLMWVGS
jgi:hypothetical protein